MKGVILAGGTGTRLMPLTKVINKCLLPVYDKPIIYYPIETLKKLGVSDIMIVLGGNSVGDVMNLLGDGSSFNVELTYKIQNIPNGIARGLYLAKNFVGNDTVAFILSDNIFFEDFSTVYPPTVFLKEVDNPKRFGCVEFDENKNIKKVIEKPEIPSSNFAVTGLYIYPSDVFSIIEKLKPSKRGEYEIAEVNDYYAQQGELKYKMLTKEWVDMGTIESLYKANLLIKEKV